MHIVEWIYILMLQFTLCPSCRYIRVAWLLCFPFTLEIGHFFGDGYDLQCFKWTEVSPTPNFILYSTRVMFNSVFNSVSAGSELNRQFSIHDTWIAVHPDFTGLQTEFTSPTLNITSTGLSPAQHPSDWVSEWLFGLRITIYSIRISDFVIDPNPTLLVSPLSHPVSHCTTKGGTQIKIETQWTQEGSLHRDFCMGDLGSAR